ncbi:MAG: hypothetical protein U0869_11910 [Chloroflexota bacterium]
MDERARPRLRIPDDRAARTPAAWEPAFAADDWADAVDRLEAAQAWYQAVLMTGGADLTVAVARQDLLHARERVDGLQRRWIDASRRRSAA